MEGIIRGEVSFCVVQFSPRQSGEVGDGVKLSGSGLGRTLSSDRSVSGAGSLVGAADEC